MARIRAALLAAVRAAVLWRQMGGSHLRLFFGRRRLAARARALQTHDAARNADDLIHIYETISREEHK
mgnify:CR=1 FL=1